MDIGDIKQSIILHLKDMEKMMENNTYKVKLYQDWYGILQDLTLAKRKLSGNGYFNKNKRKT